MPSRFRSRGCQCSCSIQKSLGRRRRRAEIRDYPEDCSVIIEELPQADRTSLTPPTLILDTFGISCLSTEPERTRMLLASNFDAAKLLMACGWDHNDWSRKKLASLISRKDSLRVREPVPALWCNDETPKVIDRDLFLSKWGHDLLDAGVVRQFEERIIKHWVTRLAIPAGVLRETETFQSTKQNQD